MTLKTVTIGLLVSMSFVQFAKAERLGAYETAKMKEDQLKATVVTSGVNGFVATSLYANDKVLDAMANKQKRPIVKNLNDLQHHTQKVRDLRYTKMAVRGLSRVFAVVAAAQAGWYAGEAINLADEKYLDGGLGEHIGNTIGPLIAEGDVVKAAKNGTAPFIWAITNPEQTKEKTIVRSAANR